MKTLRLKQKKILSYLSKYSDKCLELVYNIWLTEIKDF